MLGDLEGAPDADRGQDLRRRSGRSSRACPSRSRRSSRRSRASSTSSASQRGNPEATWEIDPVAAGRLGLTVEQVVRRSCRTRGSATSRPSCACSIARFRCACATPTRTGSIRRSWRRRRFAARRAARRRAAALATVSTSARRDHPAAREPATDGARHGAARGPRPRQRRRRDPGDAGDAASCRSATRSKWAGSTQSQRQAFRELLIVFAHRDRARLRHSRDPVPALHAGGADSAAAPLSLGGAFALLLADGHRPERVVGDGPDPAGRPRRQERHRAARLRRAATPKASDRRGARAGARPPAADPDDDAVHVVRPAAARARHWAPAPNCRSRWRSPSSAA